MEAFSTSLKYVGFEWQRLLHGWAGLFSKWDICTEQQAWKAFQDGHGLKN